MINDLLDVLTPVVYEMIRSGYADRADPARRVFHAKTCGNRAETAGAGAKEGRAEDVSKPQSLNAMPNSIIERTSDEEESEDLSLIKSPNSIWSTTRSRLCLVVTMAISLERIQRSGRSAEGHRGPRSSGRFCEKSTKLGRINLQALQIHADIRI